MPKCRFWLQKQVGEEKKKELLDKKKRAKFKKKRTWNRDDKRWSKGGQLDYKQQREIIFKVELFESIKQSHDKNQKLFYKNQKVKSPTHPQLTA